jgi:hypothetical protein
MTWAAMASPAGAEVREKFKKPIKVQWGVGGAEFQSGQESRLPVGVLALLSYGVLHFCSTPLRTIQHCQRERCDILGVRYV